MLALLATVFLLQTPEASPPAGGAAPPPATLEVERAAPPRAPVPPAPAAAPRAPAVARVPPVPPVPPSAPPALPPLPRLAGLPGGDVLQGDWPAAPSGKRITLSENNTIDDTVEAIAEAAGWNAVLNTGRVGERLLVLKLKDVPVEEALRAALHGTGLVANRSGGVVVVAPGILPVSERPILSGFDKPTGKKFTGNFQDVDGRDALLEIGKGAGLSIVLPPGQHGKVTAHFQDTPVEEALKAVLAQAGLKAVRDGSIVNVSPRDGDFAFNGELGPEIGRTVQEAMRQAQRGLRQAERELRDESRGTARDHEEVGGDVIIEAGQAARDVHAVGGNVILRSGAEAREVVAVLGSVTLEAGASVRQAVAVGGDVKVGPGASVERDAVSVGGKVQVDPSGDVGGQRTAVPFPRVTELVNFARNRVTDEDRSPLWALAGALAKYAVYLALALLVVALFPRRVEAVGASMLSNPWKSLFAGFLGLLAQPFLGLLLVVTVIGIPLVAVQVLGVAVAGVFGFTALAWWIGRALPAQATRGLMVLQLAIGLAVVFLITQIPFLGWLIWIAAVMFTFGAVLRTRFGTSGPEPLSTTTVPPMPPPMEPPAAA